MLCQPFCMQYAYKRVWTFVIRRDFVQAKRAKCAKCVVSGGAHLDWRAGLVFL